jgi:hypothetical protein
LALQSAAGLRAAGGQVIGQLTERFVRQSGGPALLSSYAAPLGQDVPPVQVEEPVPGDGPQPGIKRHGLGAGIFAEAGEHFLKCRDIAPRGASDQELRFVRFSVWHSPSVS